MTAHGPLRYAVADVIEHIGWRLQNLGYSENLNPMQLSNRSGRLVPGSKSRRSGVNEGGALRHPLFSDVRELALYDVRGPSATARDDASSGNADVDEVG